jgi:hypothetical protein
LQIYVEKSINEIFKKLYLSQDRNILNLCKLIFTYPPKSQNILTMALILSIFVF